MKRIFVSDRTIRDSVKDENGQLSFREKTGLAKSLELIGADAIELPEMNGTGEELIIDRTISKAASGTAIKLPCGFTEKSVKDAFERIGDAEDPVFQIIAPVSTVRMEYVHHLKAPKMLETIASAIDMAKEKCKKIELVLEDASRADRDFLVQIGKLAEEKGVIDIILSDDAGVLLPDEFAGLVSLMKENCEVMIGIAPSDLLGMAAASVIEAVRAGAEIVVTSLKGFSVEKFEAIIRAKGDELGITTGLDSTGIRKGVSDMEKKIGDKITGKSEKNDSLLTSDSTLDDVKKATEKLGYELSPTDNGNVYEEVKRVAQRRKSIGARELEAIIASTAMQTPSTYHLDSYVSNSGNVITATAHITLRKGDERISGVSTGDGPIDAAFHAIEQIIGHHYELDDFQIHSVTEGREAVGNAIVRLRSSGVLYSGIGVSTDIVGASIRAFLNALNKIVYNENTEVAD